MYEQYGHRWNKTETEYEARATNWRHSELEPYCVKISYDGFVIDIALDDIVLIDRGDTFSPKVTNITSTNIECVCIDDGILSSRHHVNIRGKSCSKQNLQNC